MRHPAAALALCGILSVGIYLLAFALPYSLYPHAAQGSPADIGRMSDYGELAGLGYGGALVLLYGLYGLAIHLAHHVKDRPAALMTLGSGLLAAIVLVQVYPFGAADVFLYIVRGRVLGIFGENALRVPPNAFPMEPYLPFDSEWAIVPSPYGPVWEWTAAGLARLGDGGLVRSLLAFKGWALLTYLACTAILYAILRARQARNVWPSLVAFAWNPLVLIETHAMAHNDLYMVFFVLLALWFWERQHYSATLVALVLGSLIKWIPLVLLLPTWLLLRRYVSRGTLWRATALGMGLSVALTALLFTCLWPGWSQLGLLQQAERVHTSLGAAVILALLTFLPAERAFDLGVGTMRVLFALAYGSTLWRTHQGRLTLPQAYYWTLYAVLTLLTLAFGYWYIAWLVALMPLLPERRIRWQTMIFSACGLLSVLIYTFGGTWWREHLDHRQIYTLAIPIVFGLPFLLGMWLDRPTAQRMQREETQ